MVQIDAAARSIGALALVVGLSLAVPASAQGELIVPGDRVIDHRPYHIGVDLRFAVGEAVVLPWEATIISQVPSPGTLVGWGSVILEGRGEWADYTIRLLGIDSPHLTGDTLRPGDTIGTVLDPGQDWPGVEPHLHVDLYWKGESILSAPNAEAMWQGHPVFYPGENMNPAKWPTMTLRQKAVNAQAEGRIGDAIGLWYDALNAPDWESSDTWILSRISHLFAQRGDFAHAIEFQERYVELLELERRFSAGELPDIFLFAIGAVQSLESLDIWIMHATTNLDAYKAGQQTIFFE